MAKIGKNNSKISVMIPKMGAQEDPYVLVGINGVITQIPRGKPVMVSREIFDIIRRSDDAKQVSEAFLAGNVYSN